MRYNKFLTILFFLLINFNLYSQSSDSIDLKNYQQIVDNIIKYGLERGKAYEMLQGLTSIGPRLSGSTQCTQAIAWVKEQMISLGFDNVYTQSVMVPRWERGAVEEAHILDGGEKLSICALGGSIATPEEGITGDIIEVHSVDELHVLKNQVKGKIVFWNKLMDKSKFNQGSAYGEAAFQRTQGAIEAAKFGGIASISRSLTIAEDDIPHTGVMYYNESIPKIPAAAISTKSADYLSKKLKENSHLKVNIKLSCRILPDTVSANVIGELRGIEKPNEIIIVGGHIDSWDKGTGAHDDASGCIHAIEALRIIKELNLKPKRTLRAVMFVNEENGLRGGKQYAENILAKEKHILALESDAGGFTPRGFGVNADSATLEKIKKLEHFLKPIDVDRITQGGGGVDISPLGKLGIPTAGLRVDGHKYFDYHHSENDTIDKVHPRELELGAIAIAIFVYLIAEFGL